MESKTLRHSWTIPSDAIASWNSFSAAWKPDTAARQFARHSRTSACQTQPHVSFSGEGGAERNSEPLPATRQPLRQRRSSFQSIAETKISVRLAAVGRSTSILGRCRRTRWLPGTASRPPDSIRWRASRGEHGVVGVMVEGGQRGRERGRERKATKHTHLVSCEQVTPVGVFFMSEVP